MLPEIKSFGGTLERGLSIVVRGAWGGGGVGDGKGCRGLDFIL